MEMLKDLSFFSLRKRKLRQGCHCWFFYSLIVGYIEDFLEMHRKKTMKKKKKKKKAINTSYSNGNLIRYKEKILHLDIGLALEQVPREVGQYSSAEIFKTCPGKLLSNLM